MFEQLNKNEAFLIEKFKKHPLFVSINTMEWSDFLNILIQRRFLSLSIVNTYDLVIDALCDLESLKTVRSILSEEYPRNTKGEPLLSHRELLFQDLISLGATREQILTTAETQETKIIRQKSLDFFTKNFDHQYYEIGILTALRFWAEVLVSIEYECLWKKMSERLSEKTNDNKVKSEFYYFHKIHDAKISDIGNESIFGGLTHSDELAIHLKRLIASPEACDYCIDIESDICNLKYKFYDQFL